MALIPLPGWIADTNGYYRALGVPTWADRKEIGRAYLAGPQTCWRTHVVTQLLNPEIRRRYDETPLGSIFLDRYLLDRVRRTRLVKRNGGASTLSAHHATLDRVTLDTAVNREQIDPSTAAGWAYSFYLWETDHPDKKILSELQTRLVSALGTVGVHLYLAVGLRGGEGPSIAVMIVGHRVVVFLHEDADLTDTLITYAATRIAQHTLIPT